MPTCTPLYGLEYAIGSDDPCAIGETLCAFAASVETQLDLLDAVVDRVADTVPMAQVRATVPFNVTLAVAANYATSLPFDTIDADTADMVDLAVNPFRVALPRTGRYYVAFQVTISGLTTNDNITATWGTAFDQYLSDGSTPIVLNGAGILRYTSSSDVPDTTSNNLTLNITSALSAQTFSFTSVKALAVWLGDLP